MPECKEVYIVLNVRVILRSHPSLIIVIHSVGQHIMDVGCHKNS